MDKQTDTELTNIEFEMLFAFLSTAKAEGLQVTANIAAGGTRLTVLRSIQKIERAIKSSVESREVD